ncbi:hypothetical protein [Niastella populi]|uniref:Uncharacterized protein n=1 Tax=Niastella populi TaxID=550983 RepID=A0A1V9EVP9_9BACT|nr:hypothetical protein [Niastella populi]OQP50243.1 hypothetical protein A4R26_29905 [Niastella populi]
MDQVLKVFFRYQAEYYSAYITIVHQFEIDFVFIEFLDDVIIDSFHTSYLSYAGKNGFKKLDVYHSVSLRPILSSIVHIIQNAQQHCDKNADEMPDEEYIRQN